MPPRYADLPFVQDYIDPFYDTHVLYEALGVYKDQSHEQIHDIFAEKLHNAYKKTKDPQEHNAWGDYTRVMMAMDMFATPRKKSVYDLKGDLELSKSWLEHDTVLSEFYQNHCLYGAVGANRYDDYHKIRDALKNTAYQILKDKKKPDPTHDWTSEMLWYNACHCFMNVQRKTQYDETGDKKYMFFSE